jgi:hypothetical protein
MPSEILILIAIKKIAIKKIAIKKFHFFSDLPPWAYDFSIVDILVERALLTYNQHLLKSDSWIFLFAKNALLLLT